MDFSSVFIQILILFSLMLIGYACGRLGLFSQGFIKDLTALLMSVGLPAAVFASMLQESSPALGGASLWIFLAGLAFLALADLLAWGLSRLLPLPADKRGIWAFAAVIPNNIFMGFPVVHALFGQTGLLLAAILNAAIAIHVYTVGLLMLSARPERKNRLPLRQTLLSNINIALMLGLLFFLTQIRLPGFIQAAAANLGQITSPLSMLLLGLHMAKGSLLAAFRDKHALSVAGVRLGLMPLLLLLLGRFFVAPAFVLPYQVLAITMAMPTAVLIVVFTGHFNGNTAFATNTVVVSTCLSLLTIPLLMQLL